MDMLTEIIFTITLFANLLVAGMVIYSIARPARRIWPPSRLEIGWRYLMWVAFFVCSLGILVLGVVDWNSMTVFPWLRWPVGVPLWLGGQALILWSIACLGWAPSFGSQQGLTLRGPYRFSRNPQYLGFIAALIGWPLVASSLYTLLLGIVGAAILAITPLAEESWLREKYGDPYVQYMQCVPRFLPWRISARKSKKRPW